MARQSKNLDGSKPGESNTAAMSGGKLQHQAAAPRQRPSPFQNGLLLQIHRNMRVKVHGSRLMYTLTQRTMVTHRRQ